MPPQSFIFMGRYGAGKGTQSQLIIQFLEKKYDSPILHIETGAEFRKFFEGSSHTAKLTKELIEQGFLMPEFMPIYVWSDLLVHKFTGREHLVFDGTPRKLAEAKMLDGIFPFYGLSKPWVIYLDVDHEASMTRLGLRSQKSGRKDDHPDAIAKRRQAYEEDVIPAIEWYRTDPNVNFLDIDGERSIEEIHADIVKKIGLE